MKSYIIENKNFNNLSQITKFLHNKILYKRLNFYILNWIIYPKWFIVLQIQKNSEIRDNQILNKSAFLNLFLPAVTLSVGCAYFTL